MVFYNTNLLFHTIQKLDCKCQYKYNSWNNAIPRPKFLCTFMQVWLLYYGIRVMLISNEALVDIPCNKSSRGHGCHEPIAPKPLRGMDPILCLPRTM